jgi:hypothetical protein
MPGGGQLPLIAYGTQNGMVSANPEMTNYYKVFKRYTHFSQENITIPMDGPNEMMMDTPIRVRAKIPRHADLLTDLVFVFRIPEIYSKIFPIPDSQDEYAASFRWIHMLGPMMIDSAAIFVGGSKVQEFPGEWIALRAQMDMPTDQYLKWRAMVGDVPELHTPEWGVYGKSPNYPYQKGTYPHTVPDASGNPTAPSLPGREIRVPLPFWFTEDTGRALPLVALQQHEVEVQITLKTLREIYRILDPVYQKESTRNGRRLVPNPDLPTSYDPNSPGDNDNLTLQDNYESYDPPNYCSLRYFYTDAGQPIPPQDGFIMNLQLEGNYVYLTDKERIMFVERELQSLVHQVQLFRFPGIATRTKLDMDIHNLVHRIVFFGRRSDAIESRNDYLNCSNWKYLNQAPYWPITGGGGISNSGRLIPYSQREILQSARILCAGNELFEEKPANYFELQNPLMTTTGGGTSGLMPGALKPDDVMGPIYHLPFAIHASDHFQPSGTLNTSRLREIQLEVQPTALDPNSPYVYDFTVYVESLNKVIYKNGMAGLEFAL